MKTPVTLVLLFLLSACQQRKNSKEQTRAVIAAEKINPTKDQAERRERSENYCKAHNIPIYTNPTALFVDPEEQVIIRSKDEVVDRALALFYISLKSEDPEQKDLAEMERKYNIRQKLTENEKAYAYANQPTQQQKVDASWRYESLHVMLWALGFVDTLSYPSTMCNVVNDVSIINDLTEQQFRDKAKLRSRKEILDAADLILRLDWACVNASVNKQPSPGNLDSQVVYERHLSLNWLINYLNQEWDDVSTDT